MDLRRLDLNALVTLDALLTEQSVTAASQRLGIGQPAASAALARMRKVFRDELLVRRGRSMELTPYAIGLVDKLRAALDAIDELVSVPDAFDAATAQRQFTLAASDYISVVFGRALIARLRGVAPGVRLHLSAVTGRHAELLRRGEADLAVMPAGLTEGPRELAQTVLFQEDLVAAVCASNEEVSDRLTAEQIRELPYLSWTPDGGPPSLFEAELDRHGLTRRVAGSSPSLVAALFMLPGTRMYTITPRRLPPAVLGPSSPVRVIEPGVELRGMQECMFWPARLTHDAGHAWLRSQARAVAADL